MELAGTAEALLARGLARRTARLYLRTLQAAEQWFEERGSCLASAPASLVAAYIDSRPKSFATRNLERAAIRQYWAIIERTDGPVGALRVPPKPAMVCRALEEDDARILAKAARSRGDPPGLAVSLGFYLALRREEIATLRWDCFCDGWVTIVGKFDKTRHIPTHPVITELLAEHPRVSEYVFPGRTGPHVAPATVWHWFKVVGREAGVEGVRPHVGRHSALATANDRTGDLRSVQAFAGHSRPETTAGYTRATARRLRAVVESLEY